MKKFDLGQTINTLANLGVIAGIVFLVFELEQNNQIMELEANAVKTQIRLDGWSQIADDPRLVSMMIKDRTGEELSDVSE